MNEALSLQERFPNASRLPYLLEPWTHQLQAIDEAIPLDDYALLFEMGAGKTGTLINILRAKYMLHKGVLKTLILCPLIVCENWKAEFKKHSKLAASEITVLTGPGIKRVRDFKKAPGKIIVTNYEGLLMRELYALLEGWGIEVLVLDESHRCKDPKSKRTKLATALADKTRYRYILSGTPVLKDAMDLFAQFRILDGGKTFGSNFFVFRAEYFYDKNAGMPKAKYFPDWRIKKDAVEKIQKKIRPKALAVRKVDCLDLPPLVKQKIHVELGTLQKKLYDEMKRDFITFVEGKACTAQLAMTRALRLQQIASGYIALEGDAGYEQVQIKDNPRAHALRELLEEITPSAKALVWACFRENYRAITAVLDSMGVGYVVCHGEVSHADKMAAVERFNADPTCRVFLGHPGSGGIGINLTAASYSIFYSRSFSLEHDLQAEARNHRGGSEIHEKITRIDLVAKGTIDERIAEALDAKVEISDRVLQEVIATL